MRVLKPGGHLLAFSAARTYHHLATNIENCGFEIRDQLMWIYASGFPKAQDIGKAIQKRQGVQETKDYEWNRPVKGGRGNGDLGKGKFVGDAEVVATSPEAQQWSGWKTALKPAHEPIVMARKPFKGSCIDNVLEHGTGALNIDATRITTDNPPNKQVGYDYGATIGGADPLNRRAESNIDHQYIPDDKGRFPSNVFGEILDYQKYFYCPKVSRGERHCGFEQNNIPTSEGGMYDNHGTGVMYNIGTDMKSKKSSLDHIPTDSDGMLDKGVLYQHTKGGSLDHIVTIDKMIEEMNGKYTGNDRQEIKLPHMSGNIKVNGIADEYAKWTKMTGQNNAVGKIQTGLTDKNGNVQTFTSDPATHNVGNNHPTVKPVALMSYLVKLVTPEGGKVLDPFNGSGSTGMACVQHGFAYTGCELDPTYVEIANKRINGWYNKTQPDNNFNELFEGDKP